eukprot:COSAG06_NODE_26132_length_620_cov_133.347409_1_plen_168_part_10
MPPVSCGLRVLCGAASWCWVGVCVWLCFVMGLLSLCLCSVSLCLCVSGGRPALGLARSRLSLCLAGCASSWATRCVSLCVWPAVPPLGLALCVWLLLCGLAGCASSRAARLLSVSLPVAGCACVRVVCWQRALSSGLVRHCVTEPQRKISSRVTPCSRSIVLILLPTP